MILRLIFIFFCINVHKITGAQNITGIWKGNYSRTHLFTDPKSLVVEINLINDTIIDGLSHLYYKKNIYEHHKITGKYNPKDSTLIFQESFVETNFKYVVYEVKYKMKVKVIENGLRLEGKWKGIKSIMGYLPYHTVWLEKINLIIPKKISTDSSAINNFDVNVQKLNRITDIQKLIEINKEEKDSIKISLYDNGEVDGDSVTVYKDDSLVVIKKMIGSIPIVFYLSLDKTKPFNKIKMIAENMGSIPPNTALMIIETSKNRYEVRLNSDFKKNATVEFFLKE